MDRKRIGRLFSGCAVLTGIFVYFKNAWISEDAYILFRSIEQFFAGHGPIWNPHERVQVYTSPLWYWILVLSRIISKNLYLDAIGVSFLLFLTVLFLLYKLFRNNAVFFVIVFTMVLSNGFFDFSSSGLENSLIYILLFVFMGLYWELFHGNNRDICRKIIRRIMWITGLITLTRHDVILLIVVPIAYVVFRFRREFTFKRWIILLLPAVLPLVLWTSFSLVYYGVPFPNTAYAKLSTGIPRKDYIHQGILYLEANVLMDPITILVVISAMVWPVDRRIRSAKRVISLSIVLYLIYIINIGGDFMMGRFLSGPFCLALISWGVWIARRLTVRWTGRILLVPIVMYALLFPHIPLTSKTNYFNNLELFGVSDERGCYFPYLSLRAYIGRDKTLPYFPDYYWAKEGYESRFDSRPVIITKNIGILGYWTGIEKIIIDQAGLADPLLSRLPIRGRWRIGHFFRRVPDGYPESLRSGAAYIKNTALNEYYKKIKILTQQRPLCSRERLKTIVLFNLGKYDYLIR